MVLLETTPCLQRSSDRETSFNPLVPALPKGKLSAAAVQLMVLW